MNEKEEKLILKYYESKGSFLTKNEFAGIEITRKYPNGFTFQLGTFSMTLFYDDWVPVIEEGVRMEFEKKSQK